MKPKTIAVLGTGSMGSRMAARWLAAGHPVTVYNRTMEATRELQSKGATGAATPREAAQNADVVISMVRDNEASRDVWLNAETGAIHGLKSNAVVIESSTLTPAWVQELAMTLTNVGCLFLEAPVLGTRPQAEAGALIYLVGGAAEILESVREVLQVISGAIHHVGEAGEGAAIKLAVNAQYGVQVAIWAETLVLLERQGIANERAVEILNTLPTTSPALQIGGKLMVAKNYAPMFPIELVAKDFSYAASVAQSQSLTLPVLEAAQELYREATAQGFGANNIIGVAQMFS